jgi:hypothetical protein
MPRHTLPQLLGGSRARALLIACGMDTGVSEADIRAHTNGLLASFAGLLRAARVPLHPSLPSDETGAAEIEISAARIEADVTALLLMSRRFLEVLADQSP